MLRRVGSHRAVTTGSGIAFAEAQIQSCGKIPNAAVGVHCLAVSGITRCRIGEPARRPAKGMTVRMAFHLLHPPPRKPHVVREPPRGQRARNDPALLRQFRRVPTKRRVSGKRGSLMAKHVFYSFHYIPDCSRVSQVRNIGMIDANCPAHDNDWERIKQGGDAAIQRWIDDQLKGRSCTVVMIGTLTCGRKWIDYEIRKSWTEGKGVVGVHIHNLKNFQGLQSSRGLNPFVTTTVNGGRTSLADIVKAYEPPSSDSKQVYAHIAANLPGWIDEAIQIRNEW